MDVQMQLFPTNTNEEYYWQDEEIYRRWRDDGVTKAKLAREYGRQPMAIFSIIDRRKGRDEELWKAIEQAVVYLCYDFTMIQRTYNCLTRNGYQTLSDISDLDINDFVDTVRNAGQKVGDILRTIQS